MTFTPQNAGWNKGLTSKTSKSVWNSAHHRGPYKSKRHSRTGSLTDEDLQKIVNECYSLTQVIEKVGWTLSGSAHKFIRRELVNRNIDFSHFRFAGANFGVFHKGGKSTSFEKMSLRKKRVSGQSLRRRMITEKLKKDQCEICGQLPKHNGKSLVLQVNHKDGDKTNNKLENLEIICPNCHTQTETFTGKNIRSNRIKKGLLPQ